MEYFSRASIAAMKFLRAIVWRAARSYLETWWNQLSFKEAVTVIRGFSESFHSALGVRRRP
jgi:hypothetical protein